MVALGPGCVALLWLGLGLVAGEAVGVVGYTHGGRVGGGCAIQTEKDAGRRGAGGVGKLMRR